MSERRVEPPTEREFIDYRFNEVFKRLDRMEHTMNGFAFAKQTDLDALENRINSLDDKFVKKETMKPIMNISIGIAVGVGVAVVVAVVKTVGEAL